MTANTWSIPIDRLAEKAMTDLTTAVRKITFELFSSVIKRSPVDTGRFRANWNVSYGAPDTTVTVDTAAGRGTVEVTKALTLPVGGVVYLSNGLPYASRLENGYSTQAPQGMVRITTAEFAMHVRKGLAS